VTAVRRSAAPLAVATVALSGTALLVHLLTPVAERSAVLETPEATVGPALAVTAALLLRRGSALRLPLLLLGIGLACSTYALTGALAAATGGRGALGAVAAWFAAWTWAAAFPPLALLLPLLFPDGRPPSRRWRPLLATSLATIALLVVVAATAPGAVAGLDGVDNPLAVLPPGVRGALSPVVAVVLPVLSLAGLVSLAVRWRAADGVVRRQVGWFGYGLAVVVVASFVTSGPALHLLSLALPACTAVAVVRYRLYDIDRLVDRTLVGAVLVAGAALVYAAVVGWAGALLGRSGTVPGFVGAGAVALLFAPARRAVEQAVDRVLHGRRSDPYGLLTDLAAALQDTRSPRAALQRVAAELAQGLRLRAVVVRVDLPSGGAVDARSGDRSAPLVHRVPLSWHGERLGTLSVSGDLEPGDLRLLEDVGGVLAAVAYALRLGEDVEAGRQALVTGVAEERRRLRRDLHDGLGPQLAAVALGLSTAERALARADADRARALLGTARAQLEAGVAEVRRLVHGLRPPALDDLGLLDALRTTGPAVGGELVVTVRGEGDLGALPAAVEVAAYRIVQEALTNVVRHAGARSAGVQLRDADGVLELEVVDDGCGVPPQRTAGVGTSSMRERAEELGGSCTVEPAPGGGTRVRALLPHAVSRSAAP
jgi:signal transduction histidine kinase